jgi:uncharacterized repeat protein (TIGR01451 family)
MTTAVFAGGTPVGAQVASAEADFSGYSTGTVIHADALTLGTTRVLDTEVAFSGATVASKGFGSAIVNELDQTIQPVGTNRSSGRGSGIEIGAGTTVPAAVDANQIVLSQRALASAPPSTDLITKEIGPVKIDPVAYASLLRGQAQARFNEDGTCVLGEDLSTGLGYAADAQLLNLGAATPGNDPFAGAVVATDAPSPERAVSQSKSITRLIPQVNSAGQATGNFGLMTETRMTIAPVSLLEGTPAPITIEFLGEWVLRTIADGLNPATVHYGPGAASPETPVLRILQGALPATVLNLQDIPLLGQQGLVVDLPGIATVAIGEDPRAIGGNASSAPVATQDGTEAAAAVDVVRVQLLDNVAGVAALVPGLSALDLRIGHMESRAKVPAGGIKCSIPVKKTADKATVNAGDSFTYTINVTNPFADCELVNVKLVDTITTTAGVKYTITGTNPASSSISGGVITFNDIGPIPPKQSKNVTISVAIPADSKAGQFTNNAKATGSCATGSATGGARVTVPITGETTVVVPSVSGGAVLPATGVDVLPRTGLSSPVMALTGLGLLGAALALRRMKSSTTR